MIFKISGGIGNQMFQYAIKKEMDRISGVDNYIDIRFYENKSVHNGFELEKVFSINEDRIYSGPIKSPSEKNALLFKILYRFKKRILVTSRYIAEILISFYDDYKKLSGEDFYFDGYWQSESYFADVADEIRMCYSFPEFDEEKNIELARAIGSQNSVALHVRRGDFLSTSKFVCLGKTDYYSSAIKYIRNRVDNPMFVVFSDDIQWCKENLDISENAVFVEWNKADKSYRDMQLMTICKHNIIANSSFSWWGGWLNDNPDKIVVAPYKFYYKNERDESHLIPDSWVKITYKEVN